MHISFCAQVFYSKVLDFCESANIWGYRGLQISVKVKNNWNIVYIQIDVAS